MSLEQPKQVVLITGASTGFGKLAALTVAGAGHTVYAGMRELAGKNHGAADELRRSAQRHGLDVRPIELDVTQAASRDTAVEQVVAEQGHLDVLVNNAGHMSIGIGEGFTEEQIRQQMEVNFYGPVLLTRAVLPHMRQRRSGLLIHVSSIVGRVLFPACAFYCASKFALEAWAEVLHYELTLFGIDSVIIQPGPFPTKLLENSPAPADKDRVDAYEQLSTVREQFAHSFEAFFASADAPDPQLVPDAILRLIQCLAGTRPLRTVCGPDYGAITINRQTAPVQAEVLRQLGMGAMASRAELRDQSES